MSLIPLGFWKTKYDFLPTADSPTFAWSLWKRNSSYTGSCIRVRRSSDNTQQDIGFRGDNFLDTSALLSFVGAGSGFVTTFYGQFGNINLVGEDLNTNNAYIPRIVYTGSLVTFANGTPCMEFGWTVGNPNPTVGTVLKGGDGTNMAPNFNSTFFWSEQMSSTDVNQVGGNNNGNSVFARSDPSGVASTNVFYDLGVVENYFMNESKIIEGFENNSTANSKDLYDAKSYRATSSSNGGPRLTAIRGIGYNSLGTGFSIGGRLGNNPWRAKTSEVFIYSGTTLAESKVREIQSFLNRSHQFYNKTSVTNDLVLWYDAGNASSYPGTGTTITDLSVGGSQGTLTNGVTYSSADGGKFVLDGSNDWINTSGTTVFPWSVKGGDFSIEVWVKFTNANQSARIIGNRNSTTFSMMNLIGGTISGDATITASKKISFSMTNYNNTRLKWYATTNDIIDGNWKHIIATRSGNTMKIYVNSVDSALTLVQTIGGTNPTYVNTSTTWRIGDGGGGTGGNGAFEISIIRLYKCELDQTQVTRNFNLEKSRYGL